MILIFDLETTGVPIQKGFDIYYHPKLFNEYYNNARIIEIGYIICDNEGNNIYEFSSLIKPEDFSINNSHIHGITTISALENGEYIHNILNKLLIDIENIKLIVSHNILFDINVLLSECYRDNNQLLINNILNKKFDCTMIRGKKYMNYYKSPRLLELYKYLFKEDIIQDHRALNDVVICKKCFFELIKLKK